MGANWIVGVDGSDAAVNALRWAEEFTAHHPDLTLTAVSVWHVPAPLLALGAKRGFDVDEMGMEAEAGVAVDRAVAEIRAEATGRHGARLMTLTLGGRPGPTLVERAGDADALVVGRHGADPWHLGLGSVSRYCAGHAEVPVVVVPPAFEVGPVERVVVGFDGSDGAIGALRWAEENVPTDASIVAFSAIEGPPWIPVERTLERFAGDIEAEERRVREVFDEVARRSELVTRVGDARAQLLDAADDADLVVIGGSSHGRIATAILGSTTTWLLHATRCPVAVVPT
jgi:nucleotide-binding universal stress UspA family protein